MVRSRLGWLFIKAGIWGFREFFFFHRVDFGFLLNFYRDFPLVGFCLWEGCGQLMHVRAMTHSVMWRVGKR